MKICVSRIDKMGDMLLSLPAIKSIKINNPHFSVHILASKENAKVLKNINYIDEVKIINQNMNIFFFLKEIYFFRKTSYDFYINLSPTLLSYFFCFFSKSKRKSTLIFLSRYKKSNLSHFFKKFFSKIFCENILIVDRFRMLKNNEDIHQTNMVFKLLSQCKIHHTKEFLIDIILPKQKLNLYKNKKLVTIHVSSRWINRFYNEENFLKLVNNLPKDKYIYALTTDQSTKKIFKKIYNNFPIVDNKSFDKKNINNLPVIIFDKLDFENWLIVLQSSIQVITPECGCTHVATACNTTVNIIYDPDNLPEAIHKEYAPWKGKYYKLIFNDNMLNEKILNRLN